MSRCSRGRCGWRAGSGCRSRATPSTARAPATSRASRCRRSHARTARPDARYDLGCLYVGVNDVRAPDWDPAAFAADHAAALDVAGRALRPACCSSRSRSTSGARARAGVEEANAVIEAAAREHGALVLDLRGFGARNLVMTDHVHPTAFGQVWIAERALDVLAPTGWTCGCGRRR